MSDELPFPDDLIPVADAARLLGVHSACLYRWMSSGKLRYWVFGGRDGRGGRRRVSKADALGMIQVGNPKPPPCPVQLPPRWQVEMIRAATRKTLERHGLPCPE